MEIKKAKSRWSMGNLKKLLAEYRSVPAVALATKVSPTYIYKLCRTYKIKIKR